MKEQEWAPGQLVIDRNVAWNILCAYEDEQRTVKRFTVPTTALITVITCRAVTYYYNREFAALVLACGKVGWICAEFLEEVGE